jgi:bifunctional non-homologous end joining protein LigD
MCAVALKRRNNRAPIAAVPGAKRAPFPGFITPCDPTLRGRAPDGPGWLHEIKTDGYRAQVHIHHGRITSGGHLERPFALHSHAWYEARLERH